MYNKFLVEKIIKDALIEDMSYGDTTTDLLIEEDAFSEAYMIAKERGVIAGLLVAQSVFKLLDETIEFDILKKDGELVEKGEKIAKVKGSTKNILKGERLALNLLQRMSGIASQSRRYADLVKDYKTRVVDTRKTTPNLRILEKYAVRVGGCHNHRFNLSDAVMIKDNHIKAVGGIKQAVEKIRENIPHTTKIEVEVTDLKELKEALDIGADIIMLDNMDIETMKRAVEITKGRALLEASGNITLERIKDIAKIGVDVISVGALTHSVKAMDISLMIL
ncbi:carboxylating nicotinate-nucleotide diphosphorylase [Crassaminicella indica]|uniref:Quinolinate phosphoribosyltransferase [decarboxylating] n=1 Tax=Crassaminicella indica TaxID=2855394 RepID=A0ABX8RDF8_9CLOT|nr:carboxylating nicotinate-nucleotide diphosphorylase [Crassaminicella indica]QXM07068.1 carboxylating nicotinate-nucleotide diphosphorylase [Crassaminicella indica]